jgi:hypothetical protein
VKKERLLMIEMLDDLKYMNRLNYVEFKELLFSTSIDDYVQEKWVQFLDNPLRFYWGCSSDKIELVQKYIAQCKAEGA